MSTHERFLGTLEVVSVVMMVWILAVWHPGKLLANDSRDLLSIQSQVPESVSEGKTLILDAGQIWHSGSFRLSCVHGCR